MSSHNGDDDLTELAESFRNLLKDISKDRKYHFKTYKDCFVGSEAVDFMVNAGMAQTRADAITLGRHMQNELGVFEHVTRDHQFADEELFFRLLSDNERGAVKIDAATGKAVGWADFLAPISHDSGSSLLPSLPLPDFESISSKDAHVASKVWPLDDYNTTLLNNVHPPEWQDPPPNNSDGTSNYDMVVIGGGTAGLISAAGSAGVGARVAMIEEHMLGGDW